MNRCVILLGILFLFSINFVYAQPPLQQTIILSKGIQIESPIMEFTKANEDFHFNIHAHNASDGLLLTNTTTNCTIHIYTPIGGDPPMGGEHLLQAQMIFEPPFDFEFHVLGGNFTELGQYAVLYYCEVPGEIGGFFEHSFVITKTGNVVDTGESLMYIIILIFILIFLGLAIYMAVITPYENEIKQTRSGPAITRITKTKYVKLLAIWFSFGLLLMLVTVLAGMTNNYIQFSEMRGMFTSIYLFLVFLNYGISVGMIWFIFYNAWKDIILNKKILKQGKAFLRDL